MKNFYLPPFLSLCAIALAISSCTLEEGPEIPVGANNIIDPVFATAEVTPDTDSHFQVKALLLNRGNLNILQHGWVWSETPEPTLEDNKLELGSLTAHSFGDTLITGLDLGKVYYLRPFVTNGCGTFYPKDHCSFLGVDFDISTETEIFQGMEVQFTNKTPGSSTYLWDFGDGDTSTMTSPKHKFDKDTGNVTVRLTATNSGCAVTKTIVLKIMPDPFENYWVSIPGGTFAMGCTPDQEPCDIDEDEVPIHQVTLSNFSIGKTEITQGQWLVVMGDKPSSFSQCGLDCPVENVSWDRIVNEFIPALNQKTGRTHRLPTEAEWEYAARGGQSFKFAGSDSLAAVGWYLANSDTMTQIVGQKPPNGYGLRDMSGNVWEWCQDWYDLYDSTHVTNPTGPASGEDRVARGGSFNNGNQQSCRNASRGQFAPEAMFNRVGFRLVRID